MFGFGFRFDHDAALFHLLSHDDVRLLRSAFAFGARCFRQPFGGVGLFECFGLRHLFGGNGAALGFGFPLAAVGIRVGHFDLRLVFARDGHGIGFRSPNTRFFQRLGATDFTDLVLFCHAHFGFVDGLGGSFLTERFDVAALVFDVGDVDIDELQTDFLQFDLHILHNVLLELVAVAVQFFDRHRSDDQTELSEENIAGHFLDVCGFESEETFGGVVHRVAFGGNTHGEAARHVDAYVLSRERIRQVRFDRDGREAQISIVLNDGPNKGAATVNALGRTVGAACAVDHQDLIRRAAAVAIEQGGEHDDRAYDQNRREENGRHDNES